MNSLFFAWITTIAAAAFFATVPSLSAVASTDNVFDPDQRAPVTALSGASAYYGKLILPGGGWCTAGLVYRDLILTAAHCVIDSAKKAPYSGNFTFYYGLVDNKYKDIAKGVPVAWGSVDPQGERESDWAFIKLDQTLGLKHGWMGVRALDLSTLFDQGGIGLTAYSGDFEKGRTASVQQGCSFTGKGRGETVLHNCDMTRGSSGAPMYRAEADASGKVVYYVLAVSVADRRDGKDASLIGIPYTPDHANVAVPASRFVDTLQQLISQEPAMPAVGDAADEAGDAT